MVDDIEVELKLSFLKPLHTGWIKDLNNYLISEKIGKIISDVWKAVFITEAIEKGSKSLDPLDLFYEVNPLTNLNE